MPITDHTPRLNLPVYEHYSEAPWDPDRWPDFSPQELACRGTGKLAYHRETLDMLQRLRTSLGRPMIVNSAYRSPEHNTRLRGASRNSWHIEGIAFDVSMANIDPHRYQELARAIGFTGIGTYPEARNNFIHIDSRDLPARWGAPFPTSAQAFSALEPVPERQPVQAAGAVAGGAGAVVIAREAAPTLEAVQGLGDAAQAAIVIGAVVVVGALVIWGPDNLRRLWHRGETDL